MKNKITHFWIIALIGVFILLVGLHVSCASYPPPPQLADTNVGKNESIIIVSRDYGHVGAAMFIRIFMDEQFVTALQSGAGTSFTILNGNHKIKAQVGNTKYFREVTFEANSQRIVFQTNNLGGNTNLVLMQTGANSLK